jgi:hypothetical protein
MSKTWGLRPGREDRPHPCGDGRILPHRRAGLYAIGDIAGAPWLAHKASHEGVMVAELIAGGHPHPIKPELHRRLHLLPPAGRIVGLTEEKAKEAGHSVKVGRFPFIGNGKAIAMGEAEGMVKTVFDAKTGELLGAHMIGAEVTEMIQGYVVGRTLETTEADLMNTVFPHPTLSEMMHEAVLARRLRPRAAHLTLPQGRSPSLPCVSCLKLAFTTATRRSGGIRGWPSTSMATATAFTSST